MCCMKGLRRSYILLLCKGNGLTLSFCYSVADPGEGAPLIFRPNWGPKGRKKNFWRPSPAYLRVWMTAAPPPISYLKVWIRYWYSLPWESIQQFFQRLQGKNWKTDPLDCINNNNKKKNTHTHTKKLNCFKIMREIHTARILDNLGIWTAGWWVTTLRYVF